MEFTALYSTATVSNIRYSFNSNNLKSAIEFCEWKFSVNNNDITILDNNDNVVKKAISPIFHISKSFKSYGRYTITVELEDGTTINEDITDMEIIDNWDEEKEVIGNRIAERHSENN